MIARHIGLTVATSLDRRGPIGALALATSVTPESGLIARATTILALAVDEAYRLYHQAVGTKHLLLSFLRYEGDPEGGI